MMALKTFGKPNNTSKLLVLLFSLFFSHSLKAQTPKQVLLEAIAKNKAYMEQKIPSNKALYFKYKTIVIPFDGNKGKAVELAEVWQSGKKYFFKTKHATVLQDAQFTFSQVPSRKVIYWTDFSENKNKKETVNYVDNKVLGGAKFSKRNNVVFIETADSIKRNYGTDKVEYHLSEDGFVNKIKFFYTNEHAEVSGAKSVFYEFDNREIQALPLEFKQSSKGYFLKGNQLKEVFAKEGYELQDYRRKTSKKVIKEYKK